MSFSDSHLSGGTVIGVLEDDPASAEMIVLALGSSGCETIKFSTITSMSRVLGSKPFDLLILDWTVSDGTADTIIRRVRLDLNWDVPILIQSGNTENSAIIAGLELGADDYITKPYDLNLFRARVSALLRRHRRTRGIHVPRKVVGPWQLDVVNHQVYEGERLLPLTPVEVRMALYFLEHVGELLRREEILLAIYGNEAKVANVRIVDRVVFDLREKVFRPDVSTFHLMSARGLGYRLEDKPMSVRGNPN